MMIVAAGIYFSGSCIFVKYIQEAVDYGYPVHNVNIIRIIRLPYTLCHLAICVMFV